MCKDLCLEQRRNMSPGSYREVSFSGGPGPRQYLYFWASPLFLSDGPDENHFKGVSPPVFLLASILHFGLRQYFEFWASPVFLTFGLR